MAPADTGVNPDRPQRLRLYRNETLATAAPPQWFSAALPTPQSPRDRPAAPNS